MALTHESTDIPVRPPLPSLTGMRFVAAATVVFTHVLFRLVPNTYVNAQGLDLFWQTTGHLGVSFFFILSGFVLTWSARPGTTKGAFWRKRVCKIYPNHLMTALAAVVLTVVTGQAVDVQALIPNLLLIQSWFPQLEIAFGINAVSWSLACEAFFYLSFPLLHLWISRIRPERLWASALATIAAIWSVPVIATLLLPSTPPLLPGLSYSALQDWFTYTFPATRCLEFVLGIVLARIIIADRWIRIGPLPIVLTFVVCYVGGMYAPGVYGSSPAMTVVPLAMMVAVCAVADIEGRRTVVASRAMVRLGEISFALYMVHFLVIMYGADLVGFSRTEDMPLWSALLLFVPFMAVSVGLAWLLYRLVELPVMRRWSRPRTRRPAHTSTADVG